MSERISQRERMSASIESVRPSNGWLLVFLSLIAGLAISIPLAHVLLGDSIQYVARCTLILLRDGLGLTGNKFFVALGIAPSAREVELATTLFDLQSTRIKIVAGAQIAVMVGLIAWNPLRPKSKDTYRKARDRERDLVTPSELTREIARSPRTIGREFKKSKFDFTVPGVSGLRFPERSLASMLGVVGGAGQGKSNLIRQFVASRRASQEKCFVIDVNGEYSSIFYRPGDVILSLFDERSTKWDLWKEDLPPEDIADAILEAGEHSHASASSEFFSTASHLVLSALLRAADSEDELWRLATLERETLVKEIVRLPGLAKQMLGKGSDPQTLGVIATALRKLAPFEHVNRLAREREAATKKIDNDFCVSSWVRNNKDKRWIFLVATDATLGQTRTLFRIWITALTKALMARSESDQDERIYLVCDELASVGKIPKLADFLTAVRRKRGRAVLGFQTFSQIEGIYGVNDAKTILQGLQNLVIFRSADPKMANLMAERVGKIEAIENVLSHGLDRKTNRYVPSVSESFRERWIVSPNTIANLGIGEAVVCLAQFSPAIVKFRNVKMKSVTKTAHSFERMPQLRSGAVAQLASPDDGPEDDDQTDTEGPTLCEDD